MIAEKRSWNVNTCIIIVCHTFKVLCIPQYKATTMTITKNLNTIRKNTVLNIIIRKKTSLYHKVQCIYCKKIKIYNNFQEDKKCIK